MSFKTPTEEQLQAILSIDQSVCIRAGAGCGKTGVLVDHYLALLLKKFEKPSEIVVVTFSREAANTLKQRIQERIDEVSKYGADFLNEKGFDEETKRCITNELPFAPIATLHSLASQILRESGSLIGLSPEFRVLDEREAAILQKKCSKNALNHALSSEASLGQWLLTHPFSEIGHTLEMMLKDWPKWLHLSQIESKQESLSNDEKQGWIALKRLFQISFEIYQKEKERLESLDFSDLEESTIQLLREHGPSLPYQKRWKSFLIDEFQDTNDAQKELIRLLSFKNQERLPKETHLVIVGDAKQSIYAFRNAKPSIFEEFEKEILENGGLQLFLSENFRSPKIIIDWVNRVFEKIFPNEKALKAGKSDSIDPKNDFSLAVLKTEKTFKTLESRRTEEAERIADLLVSLLENGAKPEDIFVLFRKKNQISIYREAFLKRNLAVSVPGDRNLFETQEVQDLIHAIACVADPQNMIAWIGVLRSPLCGIDDETLFETALKENKPCYFDLHPLTQELSKTSPNISPYRFLRDLLKKTRLVDLYQQEEIWKEKSLHVLQFLQLASDFEQNPGGNLDDFWNELQFLLKNKILFKAWGDHLTRQNAITLNTIHWSKGLTLPIVILPDLKESKQGRHKDSLAEEHLGEFGLKISKSNKGFGLKLARSEKLETILSKKQQMNALEENRIAYVASTRATEKLIFGFLPDQEKSETKEEHTSFKTLLSESLEQDPSVRWFLDTDFKNPLTKETSEIIEENLGSKLLKTDPLKPVTQISKTEFSVTELETWLRSEKEYKRRHIEKIPTEIDRPLFFKAAPSPLERGRILHKLLCWMSQRREKRPFEKENFENFLIARLADEGLSKGSKEEFQFLHDAWFCQKNLINDQKSNWDWFWNADQIYPELPFLFSLSARAGSDSICAVSDKKYQIRGSMDALIKEQDRWSVIDYKTHRPQNLEKEMSQKELLEIAKKAEFQVKTYCLAASQILDQPVLTGAVVSVFSGQRICFDFSEEGLEKHAIDLVEILSKIETFRNER